MDYHPGSSKYIRLSIQSLHKNTNNTRARIFELGVGKRNLDPLHRHIPAIRQFLQGTYLLHHDNKYVSKNHHSLILQ